MSPFCLVAQRNDYIHGLVIYFECAFTQVHKPIGFTTAPYGKYTHWKQTIFYLPKCITICKDEVLRGEISCKPNVRNKRDLDIGLTLNLDGHHDTLRQQHYEYRLR